MAKLPLTTGTENPAKAEQVEIGIKHSITRPTSADAGDFSRKIPGSEWVGQDVAGEDEDVKDSDNDRNIGGSVKSPSQYSNLKGVK